MHALYERRVLSPLALRQFLQWLMNDSISTLPEWQGWMWALCVSSGALALTLMHHQFFWVGMRMGYDMRQMVVAAIHAKALRLNSAAVSYVSTGQVGVGMMWESMWSAGQVGGRLAM